MTTIEPESTLTQTRPASAVDLIRIKFRTIGLENSSGILRYSRQLPGDNSQWDKCRFIFNQESKEYDWLVVYHDLSRRGNPQAIEKLQCPREKTILITVEPSSITVYGSHYLRQFGLVITSQEPWAVKHPNAIFTQPGLKWFYGAPQTGGRMLTYDDLRQMGPMTKTKMISTVCSSRQGRLTMHYRRFQFTDRLKADIPELEVFGHGVQPMNDKAEALDPYRYHITVENHVYKHHLTEKLPDAFLGYTLPFYHGCPNAAEYFPPESFIPIDMNDFDRTVQIIRSTLANNEYDDRLPYIIEARRRVLDEYNLFAVLAREITKRDGKVNTSPPKGVIMSRKALKFRKPLYGLQREIEKITTKVRHIRW